MKLSEQYVKSLAKESRDTIDGPYSARLTGYGKASLTRTVNVTIFERGTFPLFDRHFDRQNGCATHFAHQSVHYH